MQKYMRRGGKGIDRLFRDGWTCLMRETPEENMPLCVRSVPTNQQVRCVFSLAAATAFYSRPCKLVLIELTKFAPQEKFRGSWGS